MWAQPAMMNVRKSWTFSGRADGYSSNARNVESAALTDDEDFGGSNNATTGTGDGGSVAGGDSQESMSVSATHFVSRSSEFTPAAGGPFSALTPSMWPQDILARLTQAPEEMQEMDYRYDEFGFRVEEEDGPEQSSSKLLSTSFIEDPQHRLKWIAYLEFTHSTTSELTWDRVDSRLAQSDKLRKMIHSQGIPHSLRPQIWSRLCGALHKKRKPDALSYRELVKASSGDQLMSSRQIEKDLLRTMPTNACFSNNDSTGIPRLRRVLRSLAWLYPDIGYCQGMGVMVAMLLLFHEEEDAFWLMATIIEDILPASYYSNTLIGIQADQRVLRQLVSTYLPQVDQVLIEHDIELSLISLHWFLTLFSSVFHIRIVLRIWDLLFYDCSSILLFQITLGMLKMKEEELLQTSNSASVFNILSDAPGDVQDVENLFEISFRVSGSLTNSIIESHRRKHLAFLMADQGALINPDTERNLPKQQVTKRQVRRSRSLMGVIWGSVDDVDVDGKAKNIWQTELLVDLRDAILHIGRHFQNLDPDNGVASLQPDYTLQSHRRDLDRYINVSRNRRRRAKALLDFERHDDDELGFRRNDIITIISMKDEHCWVGELNGLKGWFPAKFVELLDERSKNYSSAGDDSVTETITDIVRGTLCPTLKRIFEHGVKKSHIIGGPAHPWQFVEEAALKEIEKDFESVYSRLVLCKTFRLDEDGKVLTPEEMLYRAVQAVNLSHDAAHAQMDVKFRSLICCGLNDQVLHLWLESLCSSVDVVDKWYYPWSFLRSPGWVQIKCELRILAQFSFNLSRDWELINRQEQNYPLKEGVRDMLIKHHLFSWDIN